MKDKPKIPVYKIILKEKHILVFKSKLRAILIPKTPTNHKIRKDFIFVFTDKVTFYAQDTVLHEKFSQDYKRFIEKYGFHHKQASCKKHCCKEPLFGYNVPSTEEPSKDDYNQNKKRG